MISFGDVEVAMINLGAGLMASSCPWLCLSYESWNFDFLFWKLVYWASSINKNKLQLSILEQTEKLIYGHIKTVKKT